MIGSGIFTTSGFVLRDVGDPRIMLLGWVVGGVFALCGALCYAELGALFPRAGGDYIFLKESLGKPWAFLSGWVSLWVGFSAPIAAVGLAFATYSARLIPAASHIPPTILASIPILLLTAAHWAGLRSGVRIQNFLTVLKIVLIVGFIVAAFCFGEGDFSAFAWQEPLRFHPHAFASSLVFILFAYSGWNASAYVGGEAQNPEKNLPRSIIGGTLLVMTLYILMNVVYLYAAGVDEISGREEVASIAAIHLFGPRIAGVFNLGISICLLTSASSMIMAGPRVYYAMSQDRVFFKEFSKLDPKRHVPASALVLQAVIAIAMVCTASFEKLLVYIGVLLAVFSALTVVGLMVLRYKRPTLARPYRAWGYPWTPIAFIGCNVWIIYSQVSSNPICVVYSLGTLILGGIFYRIFTRVS